MGILRGFLNETYVMIAVCQTYVSCCALSFISLEGM